MGAPAEAPTAPSQDIERPINKAISFTGLFSPTIAWFDFL